MTSVPPDVPYPRESGEDLVRDLCTSLVSRGVWVERGPGHRRVTAIGGGRSMVLRQVSGWWAHERPTTGRTVVDRIHPCGMEWITARVVADMLRGGCGVQHP